jgi:hypothetical protein
MEKLFNSAADVRAQSSLPERYFHVFSLKKGEYFAGDKKTS